MKKWQKLLKKLSYRDGRMVGDVLKALRVGAHDGLDIKQLRPHEFRVRQGDFRIFFHYENGVFALDDIRRRNEKTYRKK